MYHSLKKLAFIGSTFLFISCGNLSSPLGTTPIMDPVVNSLPSSDGANGSTSSVPGSDSCSEDISVVPQNTGIEHDLHGFSVCAGATNKSNLVVQGDLVGSNSLCAIPAKEDDFGRKSVFYDLNQGQKVIYQCSQTSQKQTYFSFPMLQSNPGFNSLFLVEINDLVPMLNCLAQRTTCGNDYFYGRFRKKGTD